MEPRIKWIIIAGIFLGLIIFVTIASQITGTRASATVKESVSPVRTDVNRAGEAIPLTNKDEKVFINDIANIDIWAQGEKINVINSGCPRCSNVTKFIVSVGGNEKDLGIRMDDRVSFESSDCATHVNVTAYLKSGEKRLIICQYVDFCKNSPERSAFWGIEMDSTPTPVGWCAREGQVIMQHGHPNSCCEGLQAAGGYPSGVPGGLFICKRCGNGKCNTNTGKN